MRGHKLASLLSKVFGHTETFKLRQWEKEGLIGAVKRKGTQRDYSDNNKELAFMVARYKDMGITTSDILLAQKGNIEVIKEYEDRLKRRGEAHEKG